jgi:hypothetical protein
VFLILVFVVWFSINQEIFPALLNIIACGANFNKRKKTNSESPEIFAAFRIQRQIDRQIF